MPTIHDAKVVQTHVSFNYTTVLDFLCPVLAAALVWRFIRDGGLAMVRAMNAPISDARDQHAAAG